MRDLKGRSALVTGAASGIGLGMARAFAAEGMSVTLCDIRAEPLAEAVRNLEGQGARVIGVETDVSERAALEHAADAAEAAFGDIHVVCNNAGVTMKGAVDEIPPDDWDWVIGVNLYGVINGVGVLVPRIKQHGQGGHVVNTASMAGFQVNPQLRSGAYAMTKYAVVALSEALALSLDGTGIGVSVLAPAAVNTHIYATADSRPARFGGPHRRPENDFMADLLKDGLSGDQVAGRVVEAIKENELFVFTHPDFREWIEDRHRRLMAAFDRAEAWSRSQNAK